MRRSLALAPGQTHIVRCTALDGAGPVVTTDVSLSASDDPLVTELSSWGSSRGLRLVALRLHDRRGVPVSGADLHVSAAAGTHVTQPSESDTRGTYTMSLSDARGEPVHLHFVVNHTVAFDEVAP